MRVRIHVVKLQSQLPENICKEVSQSCCGLRRRLELCNNGVYFLRSPTASHIAGVIPWYLGGVTDDDPASALAEVAHRKELRRIQSYTFQVAEQVSSFTQFQQSSRLHLSRTPDKSKDCRLPQGLAPKPMHEVGARRCTAKKHVETP